MDGYAKDGVSTTALTACGTGCATCTAQATAAAGKTDCLTASPGYTYASATKTVAMCAAGTGSAGGAVTACDKCDATKFCATC